MTAGTYREDTMTSVTADILYDELTAAIRAEVLAEVIEHLTEYRRRLDTVEYDQLYLDGVDDAIITAQELQS